MRDFGKNIWCSLTLILLLFSSGFLHFCAHMTNDGCEGHSSRAGYECSIEKSDAQSGLGVSGDCQFCAGLFNSFWLPEAPEFDCQTTPEQENPVAFAATPFRQPLPTCARAPPTA